jgi:protein SCO1/2
MHIPNRRELLGASFVAPLLGAWTGTRMSRAADDGMEAARERVRKRFLPNVPLLTQDDKKVGFYDDLVKDKIVIINFTYTRCEGVCPGITSNLVRVQRLLGGRVGRDIFMYSITLKPEEDSPRALREYAKAHSVRPGWTFLTGNSDDIELLRRKLGFTNPNPELDKDKSQHIGNLRYGNEPLCLWAACPGLAHPEWIAESVSWVDRSRVKKN